MKRPPLTILAFLAVALAGAFYFLFDPVSHGWMPQCLFHRVTGLQCPGCGSQRMLHALLHGDLRGAWTSNALALVSLPLIAFLAWLEINRTNCQGVYRKTYTPAAIASGGVVIVWWFLIRNILNI